MKILNLYAGIGGNRKLWGNEHSITAVEIEPKIAQIYKSLFPNDIVIVADAHEYLLKEFKNFDFIWSSPPCPTHSRIRNLKNVQENQEPLYPDMRLYEEIILLKHFFKGKWVVENVISYYEPLIKPQKANNHYFWANFIIPSAKKDVRNILSYDLEFKRKRNGFDLRHLKLNKRFENKILNNCVQPEIAKMIFEMAFEKPQLTLTVKQTENEAA